MPRTSRKTKPAQVVVTHEFTVGQYVTIKSHPNQADKGKTGLIVEIKRDKGKPEAKIALASGAKTWAQFAWIEPSQQPEPEPEHQPLQVGDRVFHAGHDSFICNNKSYLYGTISRIQPDDRAWVKFADDAIELFSPTELEPFEFVEGDLVKGDRVIPTRDPETLEGITVGVGRAKLQIEVSEEQSSQIRSIGGKATPVTFIEKESAVLLQPACNRLGGECTEEEPEELQVFKPAIDQGLEEGWIQPTNNQVVDHYRALLEDGLTLARPKVMQVEDEYYLYDGWHTYSAHSQLAYEDLECEVATGTYQEAEWAACAANRDHELQRTHDDIRVACLSALKLQPELSNRAIARHVGCDHKTVAKWREHLAQLDAGEFPTPKQPGESPDGHTLEELVELYKPLGIFRKTADKKFRYELEMQTRSHFFRGLDEAFNEFSRLSSLYQGINEASSDRKAEPVTGVVPFAYSPKPESLEQTQDELPEVEPDEPEVVGNSPPQRRDRIANDYYPTPTEITQVLLDHVEIKGQVLEPCAGAGAIADLFYGSITNEPYPPEGFEPDYCADATEPAFWEVIEAEGGVDWVVTNPPYIGDTPVEILKLAYETARVGVAFLLRISFLEPCENRAEWLQEYSQNLSDLIILNPRPRFRSDVAGGDNVTVAWMCWRKDYQGQTNIRFINWR